MKIREHIFIGDRCLWCRARYAERTQRSCVEREDYIDPKQIRRDVGIRVLACEDAETITRRLAELAAERQPKCPMGTRPLYECLRMAARCPSDCPYTDDWLGPEDDPPAPEAAAYC
jgi:hypothetical protein